MTEENKPTLPESDVPSVDALDQVAALAQEEAVALGTQSAADKPAGQEEPSDLDVVPPAGVNESDEYRDPKTNPNVTMVDAFNRAMTNPNAAMIFMPASSEKRISDILDMLPEDVEKIPVNARDWVRALGAATNFLTTDSQGARSLSRENSDWRQSVDYEGHKLGLGVPRSNAIQPGTTIRGSDAIIHMSKALGMYGRIQIPLWHTGIWIDVDVPTDTELHALELQLASARYSLGFMSKGLAFSNTMVMAYIQVAEFILERVRAASVADYSPEALMKIIRVPDLAIMAWGVATAIWPNGFNYARACTAEPMKCTHVEREMLRLSKMLMVDNKALSPWQKKVMGSRGAYKMTAADLERYQTEFVGFGDRQVSLNSNVRATFRMPVLEDYRESGYNWIEEVVRESEELLADLPQNRLNEFVTNQYRLSSMRQYSHWIKELEILGSPVQDKEGIAGAMARASSNEETSDAFFKHVSEYIDDVTIALVAIPRYECPACQGDQVAKSEENKNHPFLIPLDAVHTFFTLRDLKTQTTLFANMGH